MKKRFLIPLLAAFSAACTVEEYHDLIPGDPDLGVIPDAVPGDTVGIDTTVFALLDLSRPELSDVKMFYESGDVYSAADYLLRYYRQRQVVNPFVSLLAAPYVSSEAYSIADQATSEGGYQFRVSDFNESTDGAGNKVWYSFAVRDAKGNVIGLNWDITSSMPTDLEFSSQLHRHQWMLPQAKAYKATGNEKYVQAWIDVYFDWLKTFPCPEGVIVPNVHGLQWYGLQPACRAEDQMSIFEYYKNSELFTPAVLTTFLTSFHTHINNIYQNPYYEEGSNIAKSQEKVVYMAGVLMPEFKDSRNWYDKGLDAALNLTKKFHADGVIDEWTPHYHIGAVADYYDILRIARVNGILSDFTDEFMSILHKAAVFVKDFMYPDYSIEAIGDTQTESWSKSVLLKNFVKYSEMFPDDEEMRWIATDGSDGREPKTTLLLYPESGFYMMRNGWKEDSMMLIHKNTSDLEQKYVHNQSDNGHVSLYVNGRHFLPDAGSYTYGSNVDPDLNNLREQFRATSMHNTITKEGANLIEFRKGKLLKTETVPGYELVVTENEAYSDLTHRRAIFFVNNSFFVIVDEAYGTNEGKVNLNFNLWGSESDAQDELDRVTVFDEYEGETYAGVHSCFNDGNNLLLRTFSETSDDFNFKKNTRYFSTAVNKKTRRYWYEASVTKKSDKAARFITVILPFGNVEDFENYSISARFMDNTDSADAGTFHADAGAAVKVSVNGIDYPLSYNLN